MEILIVGGGGREHALAWQCARSPAVETVFVAPGNAGTGGETGVQNIDIGAEDIDGLLAFASDRQIGLTIIGPEAPLVAGITDRFSEAGLKCFGPGAAAAQLEGSKAFTKEFLERHHVPTAAYQSFSEIKPAIDYIRRQGAPLVVKADGLAAGKGVIVAATVEEAEQAAHSMLAEGAFGAAGARVVVEQCLQGEEASFIAIVSGTTILPLATSQDHKARDDGDLGPNTGGMGAYSPAPVVTAEIHRRIMDEVMVPTVEGLAAEGIPYVGFLYAGLMIADDGTPNVLEFNCRFGDPETQPIMMRLESDLGTLCLSALDGSLAEQQVVWNPKPAVGVVLAAGGYPGSYRKGDPIHGLEAFTNREDVKVFHAGTAIDDDGQIVTAGGRVLCVVALGGSVTQAQRRAYEVVRGIQWDGVSYRNDIGYRAVAREN
ncbi:MAG: phosphoribosylamine--glycine ligase [Gammaproteobacteria bacterium]|nr:MAG: phosphoribosylamine--glycine ligase [Gammaproteobacteria bacterium]